MYLRVQRASSCLSMFEEQSGQFASVDPNGGYSWLDRCSQPGISPTLEETLSSRYVIRQDPLSNAESSALSKQLWAWFPSLAGSDLEIGYIQYPVHTRQRAVAGVSVRGVWQQVHFNEIPCLTSRSDVLSIIARRFSSFSQGWDTVPNLRRRPTVVVEAPPWRVAVAPRAARSGNAAWVQWCYDPINCLLGQIPWEDSDD